MTFANGSHFAALAVPSTGPDGRDVVIAVVKATFVRRGDRTVLADRQVPVRAADVPHFPDAPESSIRYPSDVCPEKRGTDVVIVGDAVAPAPALSVDVAVRVGARELLLRVHGERVYCEGLAGVMVGPAAPFERKAIVYERAYGGMTADRELIEDRNPVGRGVAKTLAELVGTPAPQIEDPAHPITSAEDRPAPAGLGAVSPHWMPRRGYAGTFDDARLRSRMPLLPADFDVRHHNVAPPALQLEVPLGVGDCIGILGMHEEGLWQVALPAVPVTLSGRLHDGRRVTVRPAVDTVLVEPATDELQLTVRYAFALGRGKSLLREIRVGEHEAKGVEVYAS